MIARAQRSFAPRTACLLFLLAASPTGFGQSENIVKRFDVSAPRAFGYTIGDKIERRIVLELEQPYELDESSLPGGGKVQYWLELSRPVLRRTDLRRTTVYEIDLHYRPFLLVAETREVSIPRFEVTVGNGARNLMLIVPEWSFTLTPLVQKESLGRRSDISADRQPAVQATRPHIYRASAFAIGLLAALLYLVYVLWAKPFLLRRNRPFAKALRRVRKLERYYRDPNDYREALRSVHGALNATAGSVVFAETLNQLLASHPEFGSIRGDLASFFQESSAVFFRSAEAQGEYADKLRSLLELCRQGRVLEQRVA